VKKLLYSIAAFAAVTAMHSQEQATVSEGFNKGDTFIIGSVGFIHQKQDDVRTNGFSAGTAVGHFITEKIALGAGITYLSQSTEEGNLSPESKQNSVSGNLFGRYYFTPQNKFSIYGQLDANYNRNEREIDGATRETSNGFSVSAGPGFNYFITPHLALQSVVGVLSYGTSTYEADGNSTDNSGFSLNLDISNIYFGLTYKF
jgi:Outer membrane protein beta-barrel domain